MNNFIFENLTKVCFGKGCVKEYLSCTISGHGSSILLAYGQGSIKRGGIYDEVTSILCKAEKKVVELSGIMPNPTYDKVLEGAALVREHQIDLILAVGGGSVIDCCKAISLAAVSREDAWERFWLRPGVVDFDPIPVVAVVTAAGTGSEMNGGAVITNGKIKTGRNYPQCNPIYALLNPEYTYSVPTRQMISGAFDTLSHIEEIHQILLECF